MPEQIGNLALITSICGFFALFVTINSNKIIIQTKESIEEYYVNGFFIEIILGLFGIITLYLLAPLILILWNKPELLDLFRISLILLLFNPFLLANTFYEKKLQLVKANLNNIIGMVVELIFVIFFLNKGLGINGIVLARILKMAVRAGVVWKLSGFYFKRSLINKDVMIKLIKLGAPLSFSTIISFFYTNIDYLIVAKILDARQLGYYWLAYESTNHVLKIRGFFNGLTLPAFAAMDQKEQQSFFAILTKFSAIILIFPTIVTLYYGKELIVLLFGSQWLPALKTFQVFMFVILLRITFSYWQEIFIVTKKTFNLLYLSIINVIVLPGLGIVMVKKFGIFGMAYAVLITLFITYTVGVVLLKRVLAISFTKILLRPSLLLILFLVFGFLMKLTAVNYVLSIVLLGLTYFTTVIFLEKKEFQKAIGVFKQGYSQINLEGQ